MELRRRIQARIEAGLGAIPMASVLAPVFALADRRRVTRRLELPEGIRVVACGGGTLGGSGKTPLAIACALHLSRLGHSVALVGHAHRARPGRARRVIPESLLEEVGDEAQVSLRALARGGAPSVPVVVGPGRASALALASRLADVLVVDGILQFSPRRADLALLAVDPGAPFGLGGFPGGDRFAVPSLLLGAADAVVSVGERPREVFGLPVHVARAQARLFRYPARELLFEELAGVRFGLVTAISRPSRVRATLARHGLVPSAELELGDHGPLVSGDVGRAGALASREALDAWIVTEKGPLAFVPCFVGREVLTLSLDLSLPDGLTRLLAARLGSRALTEA